MKYFSLFQGATCVKNRLDQAVVDHLQFEMSNLLIDEQDLERFEQSIRDAVLDLCKVFPKCTPIQFKCFSRNEIGGGNYFVRRYSLDHGPNITFALHPVHGDHSADIEEETK